MSNYFIYIILKHVDKIFVRHYMRIFEQKNLIRISFILLAALILLLSLYNLNQVASRMDVKILCQRKHAWFSSGLIKWCFEQAGLLADDRFIK
jgi:hypothetical protein